MENIMEVPVNFQAPEEIGILPMDFMKTPDPLSSLTSLAMERKIEIAMNIQAPEDIQISPSGFMKNFKEASQPKRTRRPNCKLTTQILQAHFETTQHPSGLEMAQLAEMTGLTHKQIKAWFSNKRRNTRVKQMREEEEKAKAWQLVAPGSPIPTASPSPIFPKNPIPIEMLIPHIWPKLPLFHLQWLSLWTTYSNVMQTTTVDELIEALARSPPIPDPSPIVKLLQASASSTHTSAALPSIVQLLEASASSVPTSAALPSNSQPKPFDIENLLSQ